MINCLGLIGLLIIAVFFQSFTGQTAAEFMMKWNHWQQECKYRLESEAFASISELQNICLVSA